MQSKMASGYITVIQIVISEKFEKYLLCKHLRTNVSRIVKCAIHHCTFAFHLQQATSAINTTLKHYLKIQDAKMIIKYSNFIYKQSWFVSY